jgi:pseudaminic acid cytidylyltransferase
MNMTSKDTPTRNIAIIPARGGSKRVPGKNIRIFAGRPMLSYAIDLAKRAGIFCRIIVSTDSPEVARLAVKLGAEAPFLRPLAESSDTATTTQVLVHFLNWISKNGGCDFACCIYPAVPLTHWKYVLSGYSQIRNSDAPVVFTMCRFPSPIQRALVRTETEIAMINPELEQCLSQNLEPHYFDARQFYWLRPEAFLRNLSLLSIGACGIEVPEHIVHDINTEQDWISAEIKYHALPAQLRNSDNQLGYRPSKVSRIALGCAQLGMNYGIGNQQGRPNKHLALEILKSAWLSGIRFFDTAQNYGDSEKLLGEFVRQYGLAGEACIVTKLNPQTDWRKKQQTFDLLAESVEATGGAPLWALLLHREQLLDDLDQGLTEVLLEIKQRRLALNLGVSVYGLDYLRRAIEDPHITIIQAPMNVFDRRLIRSGLYTEAQRRGKVLFIRSVYLQGIAAMRPETVPLRIPHARTAVTALNRLCRELGIEPTAFAYKYVKAHASEAFCLVGVEHPSQITANVAYEHTAAMDPSLADRWDTIWPVDHPELFNAPSWPQSNVEQNDKWLRSTIRKIFG